MSPRPVHREFHRADRIGWLRAAVLGANDGILSVGSLIVGVASAEADYYQVVLAGVAGLTSGALSMAAGEYVSVSSQADTEEADTQREQEELATNPEGELAELTEIYVQRGLEPQLARQVATQLMESDALKSHLRDELGISEHMVARPLQAAWASALSFSIGAALPVAVAALAPRSLVVLLVAIATVLSLAGLGALSAVTGGASPWKGALRVAFWGIVAMVITSLIGKLFGVSMA
ncbi:VIT family protein [Bremerella cremea]|uniref:VIT family protein n=1 Tax=Bremerella cremea TaxID=1031537 RepID=A0A368KIR6_9BACT|nr:VIT family protein [Bremerella cremea]RCS40434.1 VIT family protein [Bremerella cremea]